MGSAITFIFMTLLFLLLFYLATGRNKRVLFMSIIWIIVISLISYTGFFTTTDTSPPRFIIVILGNLFFIIFSFKNLKNYILNFKLIMMIHSLRIVVEFGLYFLFLSKLVPKIMTFEGLNYDILSGISALIILVLHHYYKINLSKKMLLFWNFTGMLLLINIVAIAILSAPLPIQQFSFEQPNIAVLYFPYILLPSFIVPVVFIAHILSIYQLLKKNENSYPVIKIKV